MPFFSGRAMMVLSRLLPHLEVRAVMTPTLDSDGQGEGSSDSSDSNDGEANYSG